MEEVDTLETWRHGGSRYIGNMEEVDTLETWRHGGSRHIGDRLKAIHVNL